MTDGAVVREATIADAAALAPLLGELGYPATATQSQARMRRMLARDDQKVLVAENAEGALGVLALHIFPSLTYDQDIALIMTLVITQKARGLGVGRKLVDRAEMVARSLGASRLMVTTHNRRADAHAFYERLGFEFTGRRYVRAIS